MKARILKLHPTQICAGMKEVQHRVEHLLNLTHEERHDLLQAKAAPVIIGPNKRLYIIDQHHLVRACWEIGMHEVPIKHHADLSHLKAKAFWNTMDKNGWVYPYDQFGKGPHDPIKFLPETVQGLADDPYRGIAWLAREAGAYTKTSTPFVEFKWANFLRERMKTHPNTHNMREVMKEAVKQCRHKDAKKLPGFKSPV